MNRQTWQRTARRRVMRQNRATFADRLDEAIRTQNPVRGINWTEGPAKNPSNMGLTKTGGLLVPFSLILALFSLLLGALAGNVIGRKAEAQGTMGVLDVKTVPAQPMPVRAAPTPQPNPEPTLQELPATQGVPQ